MNTNRREEAERLQAAAERAEREGKPAGVDPTVDAYRLVQRAVVRAPMPPVPLGFATRVAAHIRAMQESARVESGLTGFLMLAFIAGAAFYLSPSVGGWMAQFRASMPNLPWSMTGATAVAVFAAWAVDRGWGATHPRNGVRNGVRFTY